MPRVLLVDDDADLSALLAEYLGSEGFDAETAGAPGQEDRLAREVHLRLPRRTGVGRCRDVHRAIASQSSAFVT